MSRKKLTLLKWVVALAVVAAVAVVIRIALEPEPVTVVAKTVSRGTVEATVANTRAGTVEPCRRAKLSPAAGGNMAALHVTEGSRVAEGEVLLEVWNEDLKAQVRLAEKRVTAAQARATEACLLADVSDREAARVVRLQEQGLSSERNTDAAVTDAAAREAACSAVRETIKVEKAQLAAATAALERTVLRAPFAGIVAEVNGEVGEFVTPSPPGIPTLPAVDLIDDSCVYISAPIDEVDAPAITKGMTARISLDALPGKYFSGHVRRIAPYVLDLEKQARTVEVEVEFEDVAKAGHLLVGYSADVEIILQRKDDTLRVPAEAVLEGDRVFVFDPSAGTVHERAFETGLANWEYVEVLSGLGEGDSVVTSVEREGLKDGAAAVRDTKTAGP